MFLPLFCRITVLSAIFIVTQGFDFRIGRDKYELDKMIDSRLLKKLFGEQSAPLLRTRRQPSHGTGTNTTPQLRELPLDIFSVRPYVPANCTDYTNEIKSNGDKKLKRNTAYLALYPTLERILKTNRGYAESERNAYAVDEVMFYED